MTFLSTAPKLFCYHCTIRTAHDDCDVTRHLERINPMPITITADTVRPGDTLHAAVSDWMVTAVRPS